MVDLDLIVRWWVEKRSKQILHLVAKNDDLSHGRIRKNNKENKQKIEIMIDGSKNRRTSWDMGKKHFVNARKKNWDMYHMNRDMYLRNKNLWDGIT